MVKLLKYQKGNNHSIFHYFPLSTAKINSSRISNNNSLISKKEEIKNNLITKKRKIRIFKRIKPVKKRKKRKKVNKKKVYESDSSETLNLNLFNSTKQNNEFDIVQCFKSDDFSKNKNVESDNESSKSFNFALDYDSNESLSFGLDIPENKPEWMKDETEKIKYVKMRFNKEILDYIDYITPKEWNYAKREIAFDRLKQMIPFYNSNFSVILYGSFCQNISSIFSDIDITIVNNSYNSYMELYELENLRYFLIRNGYSNDIQLINARVPILKGTHSLRGIKVDISFNRLNGYEDSLIIKKIIEENKIIKKAIIILKVLLRRYYLNEPFSGGMSSFLLFHLVYFFYLECKKNFSLKYYNIASFITLFLEYFGTKFDFDVYGISLNKENQRKIFVKYGEYYMNNYDNICVESINERFINIGQNCFNYEKVIQLFEKMFKKIKKEEKENSLSILEKLGFSNNYFNLY